MTTHPISRADALKWLTAGAAGMMLSPVWAADASPINDSDMQSLSLKGNIRHSACRWCYSGISLDDLCREAKAMGLVGIDLLQPDEWAVAHKHGLAVSMSFGSPLGIPKGFNDPANHAQLLKDYQTLIPRAQAEGVTNVICFSGNRNGISDALGLENCVKGLAPVIKLAEKHNVVIMMELLNSKHDHHDYQCDHTPWGVELAKKLGSPNFKLLYDIYHMQIMEGDIIATIREFHPWIGHYHTGGVPGRHEIDQTQELYYPAIMKAILDTGYKGFVAQEFIPAASDKLASLRAAVSLCDI